MELTTLRLKDFLSHHDTILALGTKVNVLHGANGAGKSSVLDGITYALLGEPLRAALLKKEHHELIRQGQKEAIVELTLPGLHIVRTITATTRALALERNGEPVMGGGEALQQVILDSIGTSAEALRTALESERFLDLSAEDRKRLLFGLAKEPVSTASNIRLIGKHLEGLPKFTGDMREEGLKAIGTCAAMAATDGFQAAEKWAIECRRAAKRDSEAAEDVLAHLPPSAFATAAGKTIALEGVKAEAVAEQVAKLETERDGLVEQRGAREAARAFVNVDALEKRLEDLAVRSMGLRGEAGAQMGGKLAGELPGLTRERDEAAKALDLARRALAEGQAELKAIPVNPTPPAEACGACGRAFDQVSLVEAKNLHAAEVQGLADKRERWRLACKMAETTLAEAEQLHRSASECVALTEKGAGRAREIDRELAGLSEEKTRVQEQINEARQARAVAQGEDPTPKIERLDARITEGRRMVRAVEDYRAGRERSDSAKAAIKEALARAELYDALQKELSPSGIPAEIARETMGPVREQLEQVGKRLGLAVELGDGCEVTVHGRDVRLASKSERLRAGILLQHAIAQAAGVRLLLLDLDVTLDPDTRKAVNTAVAGVAGEYDRIFVLLTLTEAGIKAGKRGLVQNWIVADGSVEATG